MERIENRTFDELRVGDTASIVRTLSNRDIELFAVMSGDINPAHVDPEFAKSDLFHEVVAHGMWGGALFSTVLGTELPGPGTIYLGQTLRFKRPVKLGDTVTVSVSVAQKHPEHHRITLDCVASNQRGETVIDGVAEIIAPTQKISRPRTILPEVQFRRRGHQYERLIQQAKGLAPIRVAVVHPVDTVCLLGAVEAAKANIIVPVLVGPEARIRAAAAQAKIDISPYELVPTEHSHAAASAAAALARDHKVDALMKGSLHTDEFMGAILCEEKLRTGRRMSHVFVIDAPSYPRPLFVTDAAINIYPDLEEKRDIVVNAIGLAHALGWPSRASRSCPPSRPSPTRSNHARRGGTVQDGGPGQITGAILDGPLAFDNAVSEEAARTKGIVSPVAGCADIPSCRISTPATCWPSNSNTSPTRRSRGSFWCTRARHLTSRADKTLARLGSCAIALLLAHHTRRVE